MKTAFQRLLAAYRRQPAATTPILIVIAAVIVANAAYLTGFSTINPIAWTASISHVVCRSACSRPMIDPNVGFITQAEGHLAAMDLLHFHLPWWNYFEGLGQPLVGEMQSAALFPLVVVFALPNGLLWFHMILEVIAGVSTFFLLRRLSAPQWFATAGAVLFALNGTYAWLGNAVLNPVAFLPMLILGIEMIYDAARGGSRKGWYVAAFAVAFSMYAGFPEVAYFDGLFAGGWAIVRFFDVPREFRLLAAKRVALAGVVGVAMALPVLVPFYDFMKVANVGSHTAGVAGVSRLTVHALPMFFDPYLYGTIFANPAATGLWGTVGGYFTASVGALALLGLFGSRLRPLRIYLGAYSLVALMGMFDFLHFRGLWNLIPLVKTATFARYAMPSCELAFITLAVLGVVDLVTSERSRRLLSLTCLFTLIVLTWGVLIAGVINQGAHLGHKTRIADMILDVVPFVAVIAIGVLGRFARIRVVPLVIAGIMVAESLLMFVVPTANAAAQVTVDQTPITYLLTHQGEDRFLDFAVLFPNWGSEYGVNSLGAIDLPFPKAYTTFILKNLFDNLTPSNQFVIHNGAAGETAQQQQLLKHFASYEGASVKYLLVPTGIVLLPGLVKLGVHEVYTDSIATIYEMPSPRAFFSTASKSCTVTSSGDNAATVTCAHGPSTLLRTELMMKGWKAYVNGSPVKITTVDGVYQSIDVPSGTSVVTYTFMPPYERYAVILALAAFIFLCASWVRGRREQFRMRRH